MPRTLAVAGLVLIAAVAVRAQPVTFDDATGDVRETLSSDGPIPGRDVVRAL